jgi:hypothetical protein
VGSRGIDRNFDSGWTREGEARLEAKPQWQAMACGIQIDSEILTSILVSPDETKDRRLKFCKGECGNLACGEPTGSADEEKLLWRWAEVKDVLERMGKTAQLSCL